MKCKSFFHLLILLPVLVFLLAQCKKGDTGPAGPTGPTGPQGLKGDSASANIIYSDWLDVSYNADTVHSDGIIDTIGFYADIKATKLTSSVVSGGEIKVYVNLGSSDSAAVLPLPYLDIYSGASISPQFYVGDIYLYSNISAGTYTQGGKKHQQYRYVLIPGSVPASARPQIDWKNYDQVKKFLDTQKGAQN